MFLRGVSSVPRRCRLLKTGHTATLRQATSNLTRSFSQVASVLWHNPACSKSRSALALLEQHGAPFETREYLQQPPNFQELQHLKSALGLPPIEWVRTMDEAWLEHFDGVCIYDDLLPDDDDILRGIVTRPEMLERPILVHGERAVVGRPPELVLALLDGTLSPPATATAASFSAPEDPISTIARLKSLVDIGALKQEEFEAKKLELLARL